MKKNEVQAWLYILIYHHILTSVLKVIALMKDSKVKMKVAGKREKKRLA